MLLWPRCIPGWSPCPLYLPSSLVGPDTGPWAGLRSETRVITLHGESLLPCGSEMRHQSPACPAGFPFLCPSVSCTQRLLLSPEVASLVIRPAWRCLDLYSGHDSGSRHKTYTRKDASVTSYPFQVAWRGPAIVPRLLCTCCYCICKVQQCFRSLSVFQGIK